jgi:putative transcriptional regulator
MHPSEELLAGFACGEADVPRRALLEGHLAGCDECRSALSALTAPGAVLLKALAGEPPPDELWDRLRRQVVSMPAADTQARRSREVDDGLPLPAAVRGELASILPPCQVTWRRLGRGVRYASFAADPVTKSSLILVHSEAGRSVPAHLHVSDEELLVLAGGFTDTHGRHEAGGFMAYPAGSIHQPRTDGDGACWCLVRTEKPNRFFGWRGWLQRLVS